MRVSALLLCSLLAAQQNAPDLRSSVTLVQVDAVAVDRDGHQVSDLKPEDFQVYENGTLREIRSFSYIQTTSGNEIPASGTRAPSGGKLQREQVQRVFAMVVDDLKMSFVSMGRTRITLHKFVDEQMAPGDLVAIISTRGGGSAMRRFTTDKRLLHRAIDNLRFMLGGAGGVGGVRPLVDEEAGETARVEARRFAVGTLGAMQYVTAGMRQFPGRKSIILFADGMPPLTPTRGQEPPVSVDEVRTVSNAANRSAVVIYGIDPRGLQSNWLQAADDVQGMDTEVVTEALRGREAKFLDSQQSLKFLSDQTGGRSQFNDNDMNKGLSRVLEDQAGYYLLGFQPSEQEGDRIQREKKFRNLVVRVKRPGVLLRYRKDFLGSPEAPKETRSVAARLRAAIESPFAEAGLQLRLTPMFIYEGKGHTAAHAIVHVDASGIRFAPEDPDGFVTAHLRILAMTEGDSAGQVTERAAAVRVKASDQDRGILCKIRQEVKNPGAYHMRVAILDEGSGNIGSASEFLEISDASKGPAMSSILMGAGDWRESGAASDPRDMSPALRTFRRDQAFSYSATVYNAGSAAVLHPRLLKGDTVVWEGNPIRVPAAEGPTRRATAGGMLRLGQKTPPGDYLLEIGLSVGGREVSRQRVDFELQ